MDILLTIFTVVFVISIMIFCVAVGYGLGVRHTTPPEDDR